MLWCDVCLWPEDLPEDSRRNEVLFALGRQLQLYRRLGTIDEATYRQLAAAVGFSAANEAAAPAQSPAAVLDSTSSVVRSPPPAAKVLEEFVASTAAPSDGSSRTIEEADPHQDAPLTSADRVKQYLASRQAQREQASEPPGPASPHREALGKVFASFLEEKNIRWGELVGGLLIVCCSIALVISFWSEIAARPLLKFCIFNGVSAALFGIGFYTHHRWKIHTTSHGLLIIAILLVPLNFLAIAAFTEQSPPTSLLALSGEAVSIVLFSVLIYFGARVVTPSAAWLATLGVMVPSLMQLLVRRFVDVDTPLVAMYGLAAVPLASYLTASCLAVGRQARQENVDETSANRLFILLGVVSYAALLPLALLLYKTGTPLVNAQRLSPLVVLGGVPSLATGLLFWRRFTARELSAVQTAGVAVGVVGALIMASAMVLAWPDPAMLLPTACLNAAVFVSVAVWFRIPEAHLVAGACAMLAWLVTFHWMRGDISWRSLDGSNFARVLLSASSGNALAPMTLVCLAIAYGWKRIARRDDALWWQLTAGVVAAVSLVLAMLFGFGRWGDPRGVTWTFALYTLLAAAAALRIDRRLIAWFAAGLLLVTLVQAVVFRLSPEMQLPQPWVAALLSHATITIAGYLAVRRWLAQSNSALLEVCVLAAIGTSCLAGAVSIASGAVLSWTALAVYSAWLSLVWLALTLVLNSMIFFAAFQVALAAALVCGVTTQLETRSWYTASRAPWLDPWFLQALGIAIALYCLAWHGVRFALGRTEAIEMNLDSQQDAESALHRLCGMLNSQPVTFDRLCQSAVFILLMAIAIYAAVPGIAQELSVGDRPGMAARVVQPASNFEVLDIPHEHAAGLGSWALLVAVLAVLIGEAWRRGAALSIADLLLAGAMVCPLLATWWSDEVSVASALRWLVAGFVAIASVPVWVRSRFGERVRALGIPLHSPNADLTTSPAANARVVLVGLIVLTHVAMMAYVCAAAVGKAGLPVGIGTQLALAVVLFLAAGVAAVGIAVTKDVSPFVGAAEHPWPTRKTPVAGLLLTLGAAPLLVLLAYTVAKALQRHPVVGPEPDAWFRHVGWSISYGVPLVVFALTLLGFAIREKSSGYAVATGLLVNLVATFVYLIELTRAGGVIDGRAWVMLAQINAVILAVVAIAWMGAIRWHRRRGRDPAGGDADEFPALLSAQVMAAAMVAAVPLAAGVIGLFLRPVPSGWVIAAGRAPGWMALVLAAAALAIWLRRGATSIHVCGAIVVALAAMIAMTTAWADTAGWLAYHTLLVGAAVAAWAMPTIAVADSKVHRRPLHAASLVAWAAVLMAATVLLALRALEDDPAAPWWSLGGLLAMVGLAMWLAWLVASRGFVWVAGILANVAVSIWWFDTGYRLTVGRSGAPLIEFHLVNVLAASLVCLVSIALEVRRIAPAQAGRKPQLIAYHRLAIWSCIAILFLVTGTRLASDYAGAPMRMTWPLYGAALAGTFAAAVGSWWDRAVRFPVASGYCLGLVAVGASLDAMNVTGELFEWTLTLLLAAFALVTSYLWSRRTALHTFAARCGVPLAREASPNGSDRSYDGHSWLVGANSLLAAVVSLLVVWIVLTFPALAQRMVSAYAVLALAMAVALLASGVVRSALQYGALVLGALFAVVFAWAWLPVTIESPLLHRTVAAAAALAVVMPLYGLGIVKLWRRENEWTAAAGRLTPLLATLVGLLLLMVLGVEVVQYIETGQVAIRWPALAAVAAALAGLAVASLAAAALPGRDPLGLSPRGRTLYVYAAEAILGLLFLHIRLTMPWLFSGWFVQFWPLVVMGIAFLGVGLAEWCHRRGQPVLSEPLSNTGALLPILPVIGYWMLPSRINYSLVLLSVGAIYLVLSLLRRSLLFGVLAVLAANGSLWYLLHTTEGLAIFRHPQLWLIPPALCVLVAAHLNRTRLTAEQISGIRYLAAIVIYASSTADVFLVGVGEAPWLPLVLAGLSVLGIFAGILFRVRAFLYLGLAFLLIALFTIIWHAAVERHMTWIWWVSGIVAGALIIALFGLFEKKRDEMLRLVEHVKSWEA